jgi:uronate dehydrogenase
MSTNGASWALTGAAGSIGSTLRPSLRDDLEVLCCIDLRPVADLAPTERSVTVDLSDLDALTESLRGMDGVIHLAGIPDEGDLADITAVNILGTFHLFEAARRAGVARVVYASSNHVTGLYPVDVLVGPELPVRPDTYYGVSKVAGEAVGRLYAENFGLEVACLRIGTFAERPTSPRHLSTWASHADTIRAFRAAMSAPNLAFEIFYVASANRDLYWDMESGERLGFHPVDHAEDFADGLVGKSYALQGGEHALPQYTLSRQRRH